MKKEIQIIVPNNWGEVSLKHYQAYNKMVVGLEDEDAIVINTISALCNVPVEIVKRLKVSDIRHLYKKLSKLISIPVNKEVYDRIEIEGITYGFHPNLDEMTLGEFVDLEEQAKDGVEGLHNTLAILYRPITAEQKNQYNIEPYTEHHIKNAAKFQNLSIDIVNGVMLFFYTLGNKCLLSSMRYLERNLTSHQQGATMDGSA